MRSTVRRRIITAIVTTTLGCAGPAVTAAAQPTYYDPEISHCGHLFRTPLEPPRPGAAVFWSPFGTTTIVCYDNGTGVADYYQRDPSGAWHDMNELAPGQFFYSIFTTGIPEAAHWR